MSEEVCKWADCRCTGATLHPNGKPKALKIDIEGEEYWIPASWIHDDSEVYDDDENSEGMLVLPLWAAEKKDLA
jgi:hypothetical protein